MMSLEYQGKGTMQVDGLGPAHVTRYRTSISYQTSGEPDPDQSAPGLNGQSCSTIEVLSGAYTWKRRHSRRRTRPRKGKATPMPATVEESDDSPVGQPAGCVQGRIRWGRRTFASHDTQIRNGSRPSDDGRQNICRLGKQQPEY